MTDRALVVYLNDHRAGSVGGMALARRCARASAGDELGSYLRGTMLPQLREEQDLLDEVRRAAGAGSNRAEPL